LGLAQHGLGDLALRIWNGMFAAGLHFDLNRMPELFCGFPRETGEGPVPYPVACAPQAWAAAAVFLLLRACLGLEISAPHGHIHFNYPRLPASLSELRIHNLQVAETSFDLLLVRHDEGIGINVLRRDGDVRITVEQ
jgi:glycogen debranching enzyme